MYGLTDILGNAVTELVEALRYKPEGRGFDSLTVVLGSPRPLTEMSTRNTGFFISPSGISELECAKTKTDTAERSISIGRESLQVFFLY